jgi:hypothetical protein
MSLKAKGKPTKRALDGWDSAAIFGLLSTPKQNPALEVLSTSAHPQVTQAVVTVEKVG